MVLLNNYRERMVKSRVFTLYIEKRSLSQKSRDIIGDP